MWRFADWWTRVVDRLLFKPAPPARPVTQRRWDRLVRAGAVTEHGGRSGRLWRVGTANVDDMPRCDVCGQPLTLRQPGRHWSCCTECDGCHRPIGPKGQNCDHKPECPKRGKS